MVVALVMLCAVLEELAENRLTDEWACMVESVLCARAYASEEASETKFSA